MKNIYLGNNLLKNKKKAISGEVVQINNEKYYKIANYDEMPPFFMSIVSDSDHWMFVSSYGGLTAGRRNPDNALFPYYTDDKIHDSYHHTGSKTIVFITKKDKTYLWEPLSGNYQDACSTKRNIYKNIYGNKLIFEEINEDLGVTFSYTLCNSEKFGIIKKSFIKNTGSGNIRVNILDGIRNILPYGTNRQLQNEYSTLVDAYKKNELLEETGLAIFSLSSVLTDKAEPSEALKATTVWSCGIKPATYLLSSQQISQFRKTTVVEPENDVRANRGAYLLQAEFHLEKNKEKEWFIAAEINQDMPQITKLQNFLKGESDIENLIKEDIECGTKKLIKIVGSADGLQMSEDTLCTSRHFSNVLFNVMRGGIFDEGYQISKTDLIDYISHFNKPVVKKNEAVLQALPGKIHYSDLIAMIKPMNDNDLLRLCYEYMPLTFSRRHGDPSRPWNWFSIEIKNNDGSKILSYQGNWRDIFQNWEALSLSYPAFVESMISKFVNATTIDGYNPYRITREGIDWEIPEPQNPWANIGYWCDHQIIYLLKLLELSEKHHPGKLREFLSQELFTYANVPYRIKPYSKIVKNPQDTIVFDDELQTKIQNRIADMGADGKMVWDNSGTVQKATLTEKLLVLLLTKLSNFIPEAGIWLNTQRPEWNDANNALVGNGASMVTLYYLRRFQTFCYDLLNHLNIKELTISEEVSDFLESIFETFRKNTELLKDSMSDKNRKHIADSLGNAGTKYRNSAYSGFSQRKTTITVESLMQFLYVSQQFIDHSIKANKRSDNLYHAYNLISIDEKNEAVSVKHLYEMLEGQVAVLSSGMLDANEVVELLNALKNSAMYRKDQNSYLLYPDRQLRKFIDRNNISESDFKESDLLKTLVQDNDNTLVSKDINGVYHFNGVFNNASDVKNALDKLKKTTYKPLVEKDYDLVLNIFEKVFDHKSFTGRSGTFYGYEGLGSIYWHMVSKLVLAIQENYYWAMNNGADETILKQIEAYYYEARAGIGYDKSPGVHGAFPTDPYSHTPGNAGAQQPGMTGQVKEDIISRFGELGVVIKNGEIHFNTKLLSPEELLKQAQLFEYYDINNELKAIELPENSLAFTYCQIPVVYQLSDKQKIELMRADGNNMETNELVIDKKTSAEIFNRSGLIERIDIIIKNPL